MNNQGFTLIEILVSILILGIVVVSIFPLFSREFGAFFDSKGKLTSINQARNKIVEKIYNPATSGIPDTLTYQTSSDSFDINVDKYTVEENYQYDDKDKVVTIKYFKYKD